MIASSGLLLFNAHYTLVYRKRTTDGGSTYPRGPKSWNPGVTDHHRL